MPVNDSSPKFQNAFKNFSKDVDIKDVKSFQRLFYQFKVWGGLHTPMTPKQTRALKYQAYKNRIGYISVEHDKNKRAIYRNVGNGQFVKKSEYEEQGKGE